MFTEPLHGCAPFWLITPNPDPSQCPGQWDARCRHFQEQSPNRVISAERAEVVSMGGAGRGAPVPPPPDRQCMQLSPGQVGGVWAWEKAFLCFPLFFFSIKVWLINNTVLDSGIQHRDSIFLQIILHLKLLFSCSVVSSSLRCHEFATH